MFELLLNSRILVSLKSTLNLISSNRKTKVRGNIKKWLLILKKKQTIYSAKDESQISINLKNTFRKNYRMPEKKDNRITKLFHNSSKYSFRTCKEQ